MLWLRRVGLALGALILAAAAVVALSYLSYRNTMRIDSAKGIDEAGYVRIGGIDQWVQIRGDDRGNPVLLWLNGGEMLDDDLAGLGLRFDLPVVLIQGADDRLTVTALAKDYFDSIDAPSKEFVVLDGAGHNAIFGDRDAFLKALDQHVRPLALSN